MLEPSLRAVVQTYLEMGARERRCKRGKTNFISLFFCLKPYRASVVFLAQVFYNNSFCVVSSACPPLCWVIPGSLQRPISGAFSVATGSAWIEPGFLFLSVVTLSTVGGDCRGVLQETPVHLPPSFYDFFP